MTASQGKTRSLYSLVTRSVVLALTCLTLLTLISVFFYLSATHQREYEALVNEQISFLEANLEIPMWTFHMGEVRSLGKTLLTNKMIAAVMIKGADESIWLSAQDPQRTVEDMRQGVVFHEGQAIGSFELGLTRAPFRKRAWKGVQSVAFTALGGLVLVSLFNRLLLNRHLRKPLHELMANMDALAEGTYIPSAMDAPREIQEIIHHFNLASDKIAQREEELRKSREQFSSLIDNIPSGVFRTAADGRILSANPAAIQIIGFAPTETISDYNSLELYADPQQRDKLIRLLRQGPVQNFETVLRRRNGTVFPVRISARATFDDDNALEHIDGVFEDISQRD